MRERTRGRARERKSNRKKRRGGGEKKKKTNLLKILQIAPVYNSFKLPANQSKVPITLPFNLDTMTVDVSVAVETPGKARRGEAHRCQ